MKTCEKIKQIRTNKKITQKQLAELINKNIRTVQKYESGEIDIPLESIYEISKALKVDIEEIYNPNDKLNKFVTGLKAILYEGKDENDKDDDTLKLLNELSIYRPLLNEININLLTTNEDNSLKVTLIDNKDGYTLPFKTKFELDTFFEEIKYSTQSYINRLKHFDKINKEGANIGK
ncbi:helix-turn-helix domain-containing protein [Terrisporobacter sp.]|uniref:helix-turn-helix domain-containing protein n=1 Tax=Terrisporobacter sp. TaxID=1965305 RepID=UPI00263285CC|nr:helix-turn-helix transcriptional regulator [Terrisporobacter sp.]